MLVHESLEESAGQYLDREALICGGERLTYAQIEDQANRVAQGLRAAGVERGDRVVIWLPNSVETVVGLFKADKEGFLYFVARKDVIIKSRGEKVAPKEVEGVIYKKALR